MPPDTYIDTLQDGAPSSVTLENRGPTTKKKSLIDMADARQKYSHQRISAERRGIEWKFTFYEWFGLWIASGRWYERGKEKHQYCMARMGDEGPYAANNVYICTNERNRQDYRGAPAELLSERELEVLDGLGRGEAIKDIAARLGLTASTVSTYRLRILHKLKLSSNAELQMYVLWFRKHALEEA